MNHSSILLDEQPLIVIPKLAMLLGLNEAIVLQQLNYWLGKSTNVREGRTWVYNSIGNWHKQFPFWSFETVKRTVRKLVDLEIVLKDNFNRSSLDKTLWYSIDYEKLNELLQEKGVLNETEDIGSNCSNGGLKCTDVRLGQNDLMLDQFNLTLPIPEITTETISKNTRKKEKEKGASDFDALIFSHSQNDNLADTLRAFIKMRSTIKKPLTTHSLKMILEKLKKLSDCESVQSAILDQSILYCWQDVFEIKPPQSSLKPPPKKTGGNSPLEELQDFLREEKDEGFS